MLILTHFYIKSEEIAILCLTPDGCWAIIGSKYLQPRDELHYLPQPWGRTEVEVSKSRVLSIILAAVMVVTATLGVGGGGNLQDWSCRPYHRSSGNLWSVGN